MGIDEQQAAAANQCFYLCLAAATQPLASPHATTALSYRRRIEAAVLARHPRWVDPAGPDAGAFADFLVEGLPAVPALRHRPIAVYNAAEGSCVIYRSPQWHEPLAPVLGLLHSGGHYQLLRWGGRGVGPTLTDLRNSHNASLHGAPHVPSIIVHSVV